MVKATKAKMDYIARWEQDHIDKTMIRFPKGTLDRIRATGNSVNGFTVQAVIKALDRIDNDKPGD